MVDSSDPPALSAEVPVAEVTLLEDRGLVQRRGQLTIPPGRSRLSIAGAAPVLVDKTLAAQVFGVENNELADGVRVRDVAVSRWRVSADAERPAAVRELLSTLRSKEAEVTATEARLSAVQAETFALANLVELTLAELAQDVGWGRTDLSDGERDADRLEASMAALGQQACTVEQELEALRRGVHDLEVLIAATDSLGSHAAATIVVEFVNPTSDSTRIELRVDYLVPGALWRPCHTATLVESEDGATLQLRTEGCVWQSTGEDWNDVGLLFSTERPSLGVAPPLLATDRLRARKRGAAVHVQARELTVHTAGLGGDDGPSEAEDELPGIDDGGEVLKLRGRTRATVPCDGRPHRIPIASFEAPAEVALTCIPELTPAILLRTRHANRGKAPLLAGPVDLVRNSGLVGRTSLLYVAADERFELGWGPDPSLRVHREVEMLETSRRALSSWTRKPRLVTIKLSNVGPRPAAIEVKERIPVSEVEKVEVERDEAHPSPEPDKDGFVTWEVGLRGFGREALRLQWTLVVHDDVSGL